jgi:hypothetical protein
MCKTYQVVQPQNLRLSSQQWDKIEGPKFKMGRDYSP